MKTLRLTYATNRKHEAPDRWAPSGYGTKSSATCRTSGRWS